MAWAHGAEVAAVQRDDQVSVQALGQRDVAAASFPLGNLSDVVRKRDGDALHTFIIASLTWVAWSTRRPGGTRAWVALDPGFAIALFPPRGRATESVRGLVPDPPRYYEALAIAQPSLRFLRAIKPLR